MRGKAFLAILLSGVLVAALAAPGIAQGKKKKASGPTVVGEDVAGDWSGDPATAPIGDALGQDLVEAAISSEKKTINFILKVNFLPPWGGWPEFTRYVWSASVDGEYLELDGKWTNYSRGACDPTSGQCPPPRDPGTQPFLIRGNCELVENVTTCEEIGIVQAIFDPAEGTVTIPVPAEMIKAKPGSKIGPGSSDFTSGAGGNIIAAPSAFLSINNTAQLDAMAVIKTFVVPKK